MTGHFDDAGRPTMVDVSDKKPAIRIARAAGAVRMRPNTLATLLDAEIAKGDVCRVAELAGISGGKRAADLIPLCHPLPLTKLAVSIDPDPDLPGLRVRAEARTVAPTGVEMEALTAVGVACLTAYDMLKGMDREIVIDNVRLLEKTGGKSGHWVRDPST